MPAKVVKRSGKHPYKTIEKSGKVTGSSATKAKAEGSARARNAAHRRKTGR